MALQFNPLLTAVFQNGVPVSKNEVSQLFGQVRDFVNGLEVGLHDVGVWTLGAVGGTASAMTGTLGFTPDADTVVLLVPPVDNSGPVTLAVNGGPARSIMRTDSTNLQAGDLKQGQPVMLRLTAAGDWRVIASGLLWSVVTAAVEAEAAHRIAAIRDAGVMTLVNVQGQNVITAELTPAMKAGGATIAGASVVELIPVQTSTGPVSLNIDGGGAVEVYDSEGEPIQVGALVAGRSYFLRRRSNTWRIIMGGVTPVELRAEASARTAAIAAETTARVAAMRSVGVHRVSEVAGTADAITGTLPFNEVPGETVAILVPPVDNTGPVTLKLGANPVRSVMANDSTNLSAGDLRAGQSVLIRLTAAGHWRVVGVLRSEITEAIAELAATLVNSGKSFRSRADAVTFGQENLPAALGGITVCEGNYLTVRGPGSAGGEDNLFESYPYWSVLWRGPSDALLRQSRVASRYSSSFSNFTPPDGTELIVVRNPTDTQTWMVLSAAPDPVVSGSHQQDRTGTWWQMTFSAANLMASVPSAIRLSEATKVASNSVSGAVNLRGMPLSDGYIAKNTGAEGSSPAWRRSDFIPLPARPLLSFVGTPAGGGNAAANYVFYDASGTFVGFANPIGDGRLMDVWAAFPAARFVRLSVTADQADTYDLRLTSDEADKTPAGADSASAVISIDGFAESVQPGYLAVGLGSVTAGASWRTTDFIAVTPGQIIDYVGSGNRSASAAVAFYDASQAYVRDGLVQDRAGAPALQPLSGRIVIPVGVAYVRASAAITYPMSMRYRRAKQGVEYAEDVIATLNQSEGMQKVRLRTAIRDLLSGSALPSTVASLVGIGDSFTVGQAASDAAHRYLNLVASTLSASLTNAGVNGTVLQNSADSSGQPRANNGRNRFVDAMAGPNKKAMALVAYGFNDARYTAAPSTLNVTEYAADLDQVISGLKIHGYARDQIIVIGPHYITDTGLATGSTGFSGQTRAGFEAYVTAARAAAYAHGVLWVDSYAYMRDNGGAALISGDDIHPNDVGHQVIADAVLKTADFLNGQDMPIVRGWSASGGNLYLAWDRVDGATGYEVQTGVMGSFAYGASVAVAGSSYALTPGDGRVYAARVRPMFGSVAGPWMVVPWGASTSATLSDTFTSAYPERITAHQPDSGGLWIQHPMFAGDSLTVEAGAAYATAAITCNLLTGESRIANGYVQGELRVTGTPSASERPALAFRADDSATTMYLFQYNRTGNNWRLLRYLAGSLTTVATAAASVALDTTYTLRVDFSGPDIICRQNGAAVITATDAGIVDGFCGLHMSPAGSAADGSRWISFGAGAT